MIVISVSLELLSFQCWKVYGLKRDLIRLSGECVCGILHNLAITQFCYSCFAKISITSLNYVLKWVKFIKHALLAAAV